MNLALKLLLLSLLVTLIAAQSSTKRKSSSSAATASTSRSTAGRAASSVSAAEQSRTLGLFGPLLRLGLGGLRRPLRTGTQANPLSDPTYSGYGGYYGGYPGTNSVYGNYGNYQNYGALNGVGYGGGYRPPATYPAYNSGYQQNYAAGLGGLNSLSAFATTANSQGGAYAPTVGAAGVGVDQGGNTAQQAQIAALLGQALGSSLRPLLSGGGGGRFGTIAAAAAPPSANPLVGLLGLFG